jgi:hypothetical protein
MSAFSFSPVSVAGGASTTSSVSRAGAFVASAPVQPSGVLHSGAEPSEELGRVGAFVDHRTDVSTRPAQRFHHRYPAQRGLAHVEHDRVPVGRHHLRPPSLEAPAPEVRTGVVGRIGDGRAHLDIAGETAQSPRGRRCCASAAGRGTAGPARPSADRPSRRRGGPCTPRAPDASPPSRRGRPRARDRPRGRSAPPPTRRARAPRPPRPPPRAVGVRPPPRAVEELPLHLEGGDGAAIINAMGWRRLRS